MQNEPKFQNAQINTYPFLQRTYENIRPFWPPKNEPKTNPNEANLKNRKNVRNLFPAKDLQWNLPFLPPKKRTQFLKSQKMNAWPVCEKDYENLSPWKVKKQTQFP